jgi:hypothetical protein
LGEFSDELVYQNGLVSLSYENGEKCENSERKTSTRIEFYCDYNENKNQLKYLYFMAYKCEHVLAFYTYLACPPYLSRQNTNFKCQIEFLASKTKVKTTTSMLTSINPLEILLGSESAVFNLRFQSYRLVFRVCGLLPNSKQFIPFEKMTNYNNSLSYYGNCFDKYGYALSSSCLYDEKQTVSVTDQLVAKQINLGISKSPFVKGLVEVSDHGYTNISMYSLVYTSGDVCEQDAEQQMEFNLIFKCVKSVYAFGYGVHGDEPRIELLESSTKCKINIQIEMDSFCKLAEQLEQETIRASNENNLLEDLFSYDEKSDSFCTFNQTFGDKMVRVYNLSQLAGQTFGIFDSDRSLEFQFKICSNIQIEQCSRNETKTKFFNTQLYGGGVCFLNETCLFSKANDKFKIVEDLYRLRLVYSSSQSALDAHKCKTLNNDLIIDFVCDQTIEKPAPEFKSYSAGHIYVEMRSKHACPATKFVQHDMSLNTCMYYPYYSESEDSAPSFYDQIKFSENEEEENKLNEILDLTETEYFYDSTKPISTFNPHEPRFEFLFSLCSGKSSCPTDSAVCMLDHSSSSSEPASLGRIESARLNKNKNSRLYYKRDMSSSFLIFKNGSQCPNSSLQYSTQIALHCYESKDTSETQTPRFVYFNPENCRYYFEWKTELSCIGRNSIPASTKSPKLPDNQNSIAECIIYNKLHNHTFDLSDLFINTKSVADFRRIKADRFDYFINICAPKTYPFRTEPNIAVQRQGKNDSAVFAYYSAMSISHFTNSIIINYEGERCPSESEKNRTVSVLLECSPYSNQEPVLVFESECSLVIKWPVKSACVPTLDYAKCSLYYAGNFFDLMPLSHSFESWKVDAANNKTYSINICKGVLDSPDDEKSCPKTAAVCSYDSNKKITEPLGFISQMVMNVKNDGTSVEMVFNNSKAECISADAKLKSNKFVYIQFKCGNTIGKPVYNENFDASSKPDYLGSVPLECITPFEWTTRVACKNSAQLSKVEVKDGVMFDSKFSQVRIDFGDIFLSRNGFVDELDFRKETQQYFKYAIQFDGANPLFKNTECEKSIVCQANEKGAHRDLGSRVNSYEFDVYNEILEVSIKSNTSLCKNNKETESLVRFYCDPTKLGSVYNESFNFETESDKCVYIFDWPTSKLCVRDKWLAGSEIKLDEPGTSRLMNATNTTSAPTTSSTTAKLVTTSASSSLGKIPSFVVIFLLMVSIVVLLVLFNNRDYIASFRIWKLCGFCCAKLKQVEWFGRTNRNPTFSPPWNSSRSSNSSRIKGIRYRRLRRHDKTQTYSKTNGDDNLDEMASSGDEVTGLFDEKSEERIKDLTPAARHQMVPSSSQKRNSTDLDENIVIDFDDHVKNSKSLTRQDSRNNMFSSNMDTDDDLINIS